MDDYILAKDVIATASVAELQLQDRLKEEEEARKTAEKELARCKENLQVFKDKALKWCESYMEISARLRVAEEQYRLDRKEWKDELKDMRNRRDSCMAAIESHRLNEREQDRQWQEAAVRSILAKKATNVSGEKRKATEMHGKGNEAVKRTKVTSDGKENGQSPSTVRAFFPV